MLPDCPGIEANTDVLAGLLPPGVMTDETEFGAIEGLAKSSPEDELPELPAELWVAVGWPELRPWDVTPEESAFEVWIELEPGGVKFPGLEVPSPGVDKMLCSIDVCAGNDGCSTLSATELPPIFEVGKGCGRLLEVRLSTSVEPCANGDDAEAPFDRAPPLGIEVSSLAEDWGAPLPVREVLLRVGTMVAEGIMRKGVEFISVV
jgi:hypothetical protein